MKGERGGTANELKKELISYIHSPIVCMLLKMKMKNAINDNNLARINSQSLTVVLCGINIKCAGLSLFSRIKFSFASLKSKEAERE